VRGAAPARVGAAAPARVAAAAPARVAAPAPARPPEKPAESRWREQVVLLPKGVKRRYFEPREAVADARVLVLVFPDGAFAPDAVAAALGIAAAPRGFSYVLVEPDLDGDINLVVDPLRERAGAPLSVAVVGIGAGGAAAQRLFCERSDLVSAVVMIAASFKGPPCQPTPVPALLSLQATRDGRAPADGDAKQGLMSQAELRVAWRRYVGVAPDPNVNTGAGYLCQGGRAPGDPEVRTCRIDSSEHGVFAGGFNTPAAIAAFLERHQGKPVPFTIIHARGGAPPP
jgi:poly(3-hydroxybutyrate) depolymerase